LNRIVVDASVTLSWCFPDEQTDSSMGVLDRLKSGEQALVPAFWAVEVLNTLLVGERRGRIKAEQTALFLDALRILNPLSTTQRWSRSPGRFRSFAETMVWLHTTLFTSNSPSGRAARWPRWINRKKMRQVLSAFAVCDRVAFNRGNLI
jgi:hypothetical protein